MLTIFSVTKPFKGEFARIQRNAIGSWSQLRPTCQILLLGNEEGLAEVAAEIGATHLPELERNEFGTPLVSSIFSTAMKRARFSRLCYINADILLLNDFPQVVQTILDWNPRSMIVGQRWDLEVPEVMIWEAGWDRSLRERVRSSGQLHPPSGIDYFVFPQGLWNEIPPFATGHCGFWDNWLIFRARSLGVPVVDATERLKVVHQNHANSYHAGGSAESCWQIETERNYCLGGGFCNSYSLLDATHKLTASGIRRRVPSWDPHRVFVRPLTTSSWGRPVIRGIRAAARAISPLLRLRKTRFNPSQAR